MFKRSSKSSPREAHPVGVDVGASLGIGAAVGEEVGSIDVMVAFIARISAKNCPCLKGLNTGTSLDLQATISLGCDVRQRRALRWACSMSPRSFTGIVNLLDLTIPTVHLIPVALPFEKDGDDGLAMLGGSMWHVTVTCVGRDNRLKSTPSQDHVVTSAARASESSSRSRELSS